ncbi:prolyl aminopeptidase [Kwoniella dendrophila CBS 6074]|uniref:Proline iminopeptidase n=1 Tax=Kwoniella dendrophila CBS 6074 TaxID=1295534 RepID=A0AAX4JW70_9TREE
MHSPYAPHKAFDEGYIQVSELYKLHDTQSGNPKGKPVEQRLTSHRHGGPGSGAGLKDTVFFDPEVFRVIVFSQRGAGKSLPSGEIRENTTCDLVEDIEKIREKLGIQKWLVFGGSWGSTLSLVYAESHPERVAGLILRGIYLADDAETQWFYQTQTKAYFPEEWEEFASIIAPEKRHNIIYAYNELLHYPDKAIREKAARQWTIYESSCYKLIQDPDYADRAGRDPTIWAKTVIEAHYFLHNSFFEDGFIISEAQISKIRHIPCYMVNGRYDVCCPPHTANKLRRAYGEQSKITWIPDAGHTAMEKGTMTELSKIRGVPMDDPAIVAEAQEIRRYDQWQEQNDSSGIFSFITTARLRKRMFHVFVPMLAVQLSGIALLTIYAVIIYQSLGLTTQKASLLLNSCLSIAYAVAALLSSYVVEKLGRRTCITYGSLVNTLGLACITGIAIGTENNRSNVANGFVVFFIVFITFSYWMLWTGPTTIYVNEIMPSHAREYGVAMANVVPIAIGIAIGQKLPLASANLGAKSYSILLAMSAFGTLLVWIFVKEPKGLSIERIDALFGEHDHVDEQEDQVQAQEVQYAEEIQHDQDEKKGSDVKHLEDLSHVRSA